LADLHVKPVGVERDFAGVGDVGLAPSTWQLQIDGKRDGLSEARRYA